MGKNYSDEKFLIGEDFDVPMEMKRFSKDEVGPVIYERDGSYKRITVGQYMDKVMGGGKTYRVTDEEFEEAKKKFLAKI